MFGTVRARAYAIYLKTFLVDPSSEPMDATVRALVLLMLYSLICTLKLREDGGRHCTNEFQIPGHISHYHERAQARACDAQHDHASPIIFIEFCRFSRNRTRPCYNRHEILKFEIFTVIGCYWVFTLSTSSRRAFRVCCFLLPDSLRSKQ